MLSRQNRLPRLSFREVLNKGHFFRAGAATLKCLGTTGEIAPRFGFSVSRTVAPKAAVRNKIRRRARVAVSKRLSEIKAGTDCVFLFTNRAARATFKDFEKDITSLLSQARILK